MKRVHYIIINHSIDHEPSYALSRNLYDLHGIHCIRDHSWVCYRVNGWLVAIVSVNVCHYLPLMVKGWLLSVHG